MSVDLKIFEKAYEEQDYDPNEEYIDVPEFEEFLGQLFSKHVNESDRWTKIKVKDHEYIQENDHGYEACENAWGIIKFKEKYYKANWYYSSSEWYDFDGIQDTIVEVTPKEEVVTKFYDTNGIEIKGGI